MIVFVLSNRTRSFFREEGGIFIHFISEGSICILFYYFSFLVFWYFGILVYLLLFFFVYLHQIIKGREREMVFVWDFVFSFFLYLLFWKREREREVLDWGTPIIVVLFFFSLFFCDVKSSFLKQPQTPLFYDGFVFIFYFSNSFSFPFSFPIPFFFYGSFSFYIPFFFQETMSLPELPQIGFCEQWGSS